MCSAYVWPRSVQGQGHNLRLNIVWLYFVSAQYILNPCWDLQITLHKCQVCWDDVQCICLTKVGSRSRSEFKIKHCITYQVQYPWLLLKKLTLFPMLHMGYSSPSVIALVYDTKKNDSIQLHTGGDIIAFVFESTRLVFIWRYTDLNRGNIVE